jgi:hypothetical protein
MKKIKIILIYFIFITRAQAFIGLNVGATTQSVQPWWTRVEGSQTTHAGSTTPYKVSYDSLNNYYVCGSTNVNLDGNLVDNVNNNMFLIKYNSSGVKQWTKEFGGAAGGYGVCNGTVVDSSDNVYMSGWTNNPLDGNPKIGGQDLYIFKYNSSGTKIFSMQYGTAGVSITTYSLAIDHADNLYLTGGSAGNFDGNTVTGTYDLVIVKFNSSGVKQWSRQLGVASKNTFASSVAVDSANNAYVGGYTTGGLDGNTLTGTQDFFITKYSSSGTKVWTQQLGVASKATTGNAIVVDSSDYVAIAGSTNGGLDGNSLSGNQAIFLTQYNSSGTKQWTKELGGTVAGAVAAGVGLGVDSSKNLYVLGNNNGDIDGQTAIGSKDAFVTKYNSSGTKQWTKNFGVTSSALNPQGINVDSGSNPVFVGSTSAAYDGHTMLGSSDGIIVKLDSSGTKTWSQQFGGTYYSFANNTAITSDSLNNIFTVGYVNGSINGNTRLSANNDCYFTKYSNDGTLLWSKQIGVSGNGSTYGTTAITDSSNNLYVAGATGGALDGNTLTGAQDFFITKYDSSGTRLWTKLLGVASKSTYGQSLGIDSAGNVYLTGYTTGGLDGNTLTGSEDLFVSKYDSSGTKQWTKQLGVASKITVPISMAIDSNDTIIIAGTTAGGLDGNTLTGAQDFFVTRYNSSGTKLGTGQLGVASSTVNVFAVAVDASNNYYVNGSVNKGLDGNTLTGITDNFVTKYNSSGVKQWTKQMGSAGAYTPYFPSIGGLKVIGNALYIVSSTTGSLEASNAQIGWQDLLLIKLSISGTMMWSRHYGVKNQYLTGIGITKDSNSHVFVSGYSTTSVDGVARIGYTDEFVMKFGEN